MGADMRVVTELDRWTLLHRALVSATRQIDAAIIGRVIELGVDVHAADRNGWTALHFAARAKNVDVMRVLLDAGADPNALTTDGLTPLRRTFDSKPYSRDAIELLVARGADVDRVVPGKKHSDRSFGELVLHGANLPLRDAFGPRRA